MILVTTEGMRRVSASDYTDKVATGKRSTRKEGCATSACPRERANILLSILAAAPAG